MMRRLIRFRLGFAFLAGLLAIAPSAAARPLPLQPPAEVVIGEVGVSAPAEGRSSILVPVHYPIQLAGRTAKLKVGLFEGTGGKIRSWRIDERLSSGHKRRPEKRRHFTYVHRVDLGRAATRQLRRGARVRVAVLGLLDANRDGKAEYRSHDASAQALPHASAGGGLCNDLPPVRVRPGRKVVVDLPACEASWTWDLLGRPKRGRAKIEDGQLIYRPPAKFRGTQAIELVGLLNFDGASRSDVTPLIFTEFPVTVSAAHGVSVRALGDSVTAGFGYYSMGCAIYADVFGGYRECIEAAFAEDRLQADLKSLYTDLVQHTGATIYLMQYHLSVPSTALAYSATQIAEMDKLLNREIAAVAAAVNPQRLQVVAPPHFDVGIDISPVYPSRYSCSELGFKVDGPSVQSNPTQDELAILHPLSFCEGPNGEASPPWVIGGDTGIHPSATGYAQMASQVPPPAGG
jgi:hypothetical protein